MKKVLIVILVVLALLGAGVWYLFSNAGSFIKAQIEEQGSRVLGTQVTVFSVDLALAEGKLTISDIDVENPQGFSQSDAFSLGSITLDIGGATEEPYVIQEISVNAPEILYELDASGNGNLLALKDNIAKALPASSEPKPQSTEPGVNPLVIVENVSINSARLMLNFENLPTGDIELGQKAYEVTLPSFSAGSIGKPSGIPADQVGAAIAKAMLDNVIAQAKKEASNRLEEEAKKKIKEEVDKKKDELMNKATDRLKGLFNKD
ncbi:hypothetical protein ACFO4O_10785 [Glaciecola siphonariae]|uniref:AsmA domain-containing protein n=1 Tax=Glaciecola siphonariae TaxID=521012 RepID=A0ABV9LVV8_9ALTE